MLTVAQFESRSILPGQRIVLSMRQAAGSCGGATGRYPSCRFERPGKASVWFGPESVQFVNLFFDIYFFLRSFRLRPFCQMAQVLRLHGASGLWLKPGCQGQSVSSLARACQHHVLDAPVPGTPQNLGLRVVLPLKTTKQGIAPNKSRHTVDNPISNLPFETHRPIALRVNPHGQDG